MTQRSYPIDPRLTKDGAFFALRNLPGGDLLKPRTLRDTDNPFADFDSSFHLHELDVQAKLGVAGYVDLEVATNVHARTFDMYRFSTGLELQEGADGDLIRSTRWGAGVRVFIQITQLSVESDLSTMWGIAASCQERLSYATYRIETFGISDPSILTRLPAPGQFGMETVARIFELMDHIKEQGFAAGKRFAVPFEIQAPRYLFQSGVARAKSIYFAMKCVEGDVSREDAIARATEDHRLSQLTVADVYSKLDAPSPAARTRAAAWLKT